MRYLLLIGLISAAVGVVALYKRWERSQQEPTNNEDDQTHNPFVS